MDEVKQSNETKPAKSLAEAIVRVMAEVNGVEKGMTVGDGRNSYKAVSDKDVKQTIRKAMIRHGLALVPKSVHAETRVDRWEEANNYGTRTRQQVFVEAKTVYTLMHVSGEKMDIEGYGHGVDPQDKAAGKATTYALKYALLYLFLVPTGDIDDADAHASNDDAPRDKKGGPSNGGLNKRPDPSKNTPGNVSDKPAAATIAAAKEMLENAESLDDLKAKWTMLPKPVQVAPGVADTKDRRKTQLAAQDQPPINDDLADDIPY